LTLEQVATEARFLREQGFRHILLVAGEHPHFVSDNYLRDCVAADASGLAEHFAGKSGPMELDQYVPIVQAGAERPRGLPGDVRPGRVRPPMHVSGPKKDFSIGAWKG